MISARNILRNTVLNFLPPRIVHEINLLKNVRLHALEAEMRFVSDFVTPGSTVIDVGANLGLYADIFARKAGKVLAVEPQPLLAKYLRQVVPKNVEVIEVALSSQDGEAELRIPRFGPGNLGTLDAYATIEKNNSFGSVPPTAVDTITIPLRRLDDIAKGHGVVSFIKIDVEGHEGGVVGGALDVIRNQRPVLLIEIEARHNEHAYDVFDVMAAEGFDAFCLQNARLTQVTKADVARLQGWDLATGKSALKDVHGLSATHVANFFFIHRDDHRRSLVA